MATSKEDAKNMALLFFMDHLMQKNGQRTIHDLSCQFGARGFTAEMREAVGTTQEGLCDFLGQFPSLFRIDGDTISINGYGELAVGGASASPFLQTLARDRDVEREAVEFFEEKLRKFGPELQVKSLLGHRSQAAPEIRLLSGRHVKDFTDFLRVRSDHFIVEGDRVRLKNMPEPVQSDLDLDENGQPLSGVKAKQAAVDYLKMFVEMQECPVPMETLYKQFCNRFTHQIRQEVATNPKELLQFLKLNRHIFFIRSNKVSIVRNRPPSNDDNGSENGGQTVSSPGPCSSPGLGGNGSDAEGGGNDKATNGNATPRDGLLGNNNNFPDVLESTTVVKTLKHAQAAMQEVAAMYIDQKTTFLAPELSNVVAMDFKLVNLGTQEFLTLVIVGTSTGKLYVFDVAHSASILLESGLKDLLEAEDYVKVIHDCKKICALLWKQYEIAAKEVFDTQVANTVLQHQRTGRPLHEIKAVSFLTLQRLYHPQSLMLSDAGPRRITKRDPRYWSLRPLTDEMIRIAVEEVHLLVPTIFCSMNSALKPELREMFRHLCRENVHFFINQEEVQSQRKERKERFALTVINEKLLHDPTGSSLTSRERKLLTSVERDERANVDDLSPGATTGHPTAAPFSTGGNPPPHQTYFNPVLPNGTIIDLSKPPPPTPCCSCRCHASNNTTTIGAANQKRTVDASSQTLSTGDINGAAKV